MPGLAHPPAWLLVGLAASSSLASMVDPDTPKDALWAKDKDGRAMVLVMSDEFSKDDRNFTGHSDAFWTAIHNRDTTNRAPGRPQGPRRATRG